MRRCTALCRRFGENQKKHRYDSLFVVDVERDLSVQQQFLDVTIVRRGRFIGRLPDWLQGLRPHNLVTFKSHDEVLDDWATKELVGADVA
jgi:hypothetical protein